MTRHGAALLLELRVQWRYRIPAVALVVTVLWTLTVLAMPAPLARGAGPIILSLDTATFGSFFIAALFLFERGEGALAALSVSPLRFGEYLGAKVATLTGLSLASAVPIILVAGRGHANLGVAVLAVGVLSVLFLVVSFALVIRHSTVTGFLTVAPLPLAPLIAAPLAHLVGLVDHPALFLVPTTGAADLILLAMNPATVIPSGQIAAVLGYPVLVIAAAAAVVRQRCAHELARPGRTRPPRARRTRLRPTGWLTALIHIDARTTLRTALLVLVLTGPILLAVALRLGYPPLAFHLHTRFGLDVEPYQPILLAALVVLHVPLIIGMVGALLILDDLDDLKILLLRVSPVTLPRYLTYRVLSVAAVAMITLTIAVPVCGLVPWPRLPTLPPALVLAAAQAPLITLATAAFAGNKVEGLAWLKILGLLPTGIAPAMWWLPDPAQWPLRVLPYYWTVDTLWHPTLPGLLIGATLTALAAALLARRTLHRLTGR